MHLSNRPVTLVQYSCLLVLPAILQLLPQTMAIERSYYEHTLQNNPLRGIHFTGDKRQMSGYNYYPWDTLDTKAFVEYLATKYNLSKGEAYKSLSIVLEGMEAVLKDGNILNLDDFGSFSLNGNFCLKTKSRTKT